MIITDLWCFANEDDIGTKNDAETKNGNKIRTSKSGRGIIFLCIKKN